MRPTSGEQKQTGYAMVTVKVPQGNLTGGRCVVWPRLPGTPATACCESRSIRISCWLTSRCGHLRQVYAALRQIGLAEAGAHEIEDVTTCPGAYSCNLALTKSMNLGAALAEEVREAFATRWCAS